MRRNFGEIFRRFSFCNFQGKRPQKNSRKILDIFHTVPNRVFSLLQLWGLGDPTRMRATKGCTLCGLVVCAFFPLFPSPCVRVWPFFCSLSLSLYLSPSVLLASLMPSAVDCDFRWCICSSRQAFSHMIFVKISVRMASVIATQGRKSGAFGEPCLCPLPKRRGFEENGESDKFAF